MTTETDPLFANSCGILFTDRVVLLRQTKSQLTLHTIKKISFKKRYKTESIVFTFLPGILLLVPYFSGSEDTFIKVLFIGIGLIGLAISLVKAKVQYKLNIISNSGRIHSINVWEGNKQDAKKFADRTNAVIDKNNKVTA